MRKETTTFPSHKKENNKAPKAISSKDLIHGHIAYEKAKCKSNASAVPKATICKTVNCFLLLPRFVRAKQTFPDVMHTSKNVAVEVVGIISGRNDSAKVRKTKNQWATSPNVG